MPRTTPLAFHADGDRMVVFAANMGAASDPAWYRNLVADPRVVVEIGDASHEATATPASGAEYERLWADTREAFPFLDDFAAKAGRPIPVVILSLD